MKVAGALVTSVMVWRTISDTLIPDCVYAFKFCSLVYPVKPPLSLKSLMASIQTTFLMRPIFIWVQSYHHQNTKNQSQSTTERDRHHITVTVDMNQQLVDFYEGVKLTWVLVSSRIQNQKPVSNVKHDNGALSRPELRYFELSFDKKHREMALNSYLPYIFQ